MQNFDIRSYNLLNTDQLKSDFDYLHQVVFEDSGVKNRGLLAEEAGALILIAYVDGVPAAFKVGFERDKSRFYSWLGGCDPKYRGQGLASALMEEQHRICKERGYKIVETKSMPKWGAMLKLNAKFGFEMVREYKSMKHGGTKFQFEKVL